jgi:hypothetical protein
MRGKYTTASVLIIVATICITTAGARQDDTKALAVIAEARKAIGGKKLDALKSMSVQGAAQRNLGNFQITSELELLIDLPDKYFKSESSSGPMTMANVSGFSGDRPLKSSSPGGIAAGGAMIIRMGPAAGPGGGGPSEKPTPEQQEQIDRQLVRSARHDISRLMLGWLAAAHPAIAARYTYGGEAESPDGQAHIIDVKNADGFAARLFIDEKTGLPLMVTYQGPQPRIVTSGGSRTAEGAGDHTRRQPTDDEKKRAQADVRLRLEELEKQPSTMIEYALYFDDWRDVDGIRFPHSLRRAMGGSTVEEWTIDKVKINPRIDPRKFETAK